MTGGPVRNLVQSTPSQSDSKPSRPLSDSVCGPAVIIADQVEDPMSIKKKGGFYAAIRMPGSKSTSRYLYVLLRRNENVYPPEGISRHLTK